MRLNAGHRGLLRDHADFRRLWVGDAISKLGSSLVLLAVPLLAATTLDASTWEVGLLTACASLPFLLIGLPVGAWADRIRRRPVLVAADLARAAILAWVPLGAALGVLTVEQLYIVELLVGAGTVFFDVSQGAYVPALIGRDRLVDGNGRLEANRTVAYLAGPTIGGQLVLWLGAPLTVAGTVLGYLWSALWLGSIRTKEPPPAASRDRHLWREIGDGLRFVWGQPFIRATALYGTVAVLFLGTRYAVEVLFLLRTVGVSAAGIGALLTVAGTGAVAGAVLAARIAGRLGRTRTVLASSLGIAAASLLIPVTGPGVRLSCFAAGAALSAFSITVNNVVVVSLRQAMCPDHLLGRMNASCRFLAWATLPLGGVAGGALGTVLGLRATLWLSAAGLVLAPLLLLPARS
jgi:predicted MFS family arabinose efflux permease